MFKNESMDHPTRLIYLIDTWNIVGFTSYARTYQLNSPSTLIVPHPLLTSPGVEEVRSHKYLNGTCHGDLPFRILF